MRYLVLAGSISEASNGASLSWATDEELIAALGDPSQSQPDFEIAAAQLGVTVEELRYRSQALTLLPEPTRHCMEARAPRHLWSRSPPER